MKTARKSSDEGHTRIGDHPHRSDLLRATEAQYLCRWNKCRKWKMIKQMDFLDPVDLSNG
jgi:hypothetical protein